MISKDYNVAFSALVLTYHVSCLYSQTYKKYFGARFALDALALSKEAAGVSLWSARFVNTSSAGGARMLFTRNTITTKAIVLLGLFSCIHYSELLD